MEQEDKHIVFNAEFAVMADDIIHMLQRLGADIGWPDNEEAKKLVVLIQSLKKKWGVE